MNGFIDLGENIRDYDYEILCGSSEIKNDFPKKFQISPLTIKNQYDVGECVGCAMATIVESYFGEEFSENWAYGRLRPDSHTGWGMVSSQAISLLKEIGIIHKKYFDMLLEMPDVRDAVKRFPEYDEIAKNFKISGYVKINSGDPTTGLKKDLQIKDALTKYERPLFAVSPKGFTGGSHAITLLGWDDETDKYIFQNSWGEKYGDCGIGKIDKREIRDVYIFLFEPITLPFDDVKETDWFYKAIKNCYMAGLIKGRTEKDFAPNDFITRAELCAILDRYLEKEQQAHESLAKLLEVKHEYDQL